MKNRRGQPRNGGGPATILKEVNCTMNAYIGHESQISGVEEHRLVGGRGDGMRLLQVRNGRGLEFTVSDGSASATMSLSIPVIWRTRSDMGDVGFINRENRSVTFPSSTFTPPISMISSLSGDSPVVSRSKQT